jgi:hypothetical protein
VQQLQSFHFMAMPVMFPPGRLRFATRPSWMGSAPRLKTMGMVDVAAFAAIVAGAPPIGTITATRRLTVDVSTYRFEIIAIAPPPVLNSYPNADLL